MLVSKNGILIAVEGILKAVFAPWNFFAFANSPALWAYKVYCKSVRDGSLMAVCIKNASSEPAWAETPQRSRKVCCTRGPIPAPETPQRSRGVRPSPPPRPPEGSHLRPAASGASRVPPFFIWLHSSSSPTVVLVQCREAERQRGREAERQRGGEAVRQRGREAERQRDRETG